MTGMAKVGGEEMSRKEMGEMLGKERKKVGAVGGKVISKGLMYGGEEGRVR